MTIFNMSSSVNVNGVYIPGGSGILEMTFVTTDGQNMSNTAIDIVGPETKTLYTDSNGYVWAMVQSGEYTATPVIDESYSGAEPKIITVPNKGSISVIWFAQKLYKQTVTISSPGSISRATYRIINAKGEEEYNSSNWQSQMSFTLYPGDYTLELKFATITATKSISVGASATSIYVSDMFCKIVVSNSPSAGILRTIVFNSYSVDFVDNSAIVLRSDNSATVGFVIDGTQLSGEASQANLLDYENVTITPSSTTVSVSIPTPTVNTVLITNSGTLYVPFSGDYEIFCIGGGGSGGRSGYGAGGGGGGGGEMVLDTSVSLSKDTEYEITIGEGGVAKNGGPTSFGDLLSASGGTIASSQNGGPGGSGGGGAFNGSGGDASFAGGGGAGAGRSSGSAGTYGGNGGIVNKDGSSGKSASGRTDLLKSDLSYGGGSKGSGSFTNYNGGGGGGGLAAEGGNGGASSSDTYCPGGGGGGGVCGGTGGNGTSNGGGGRGLGYGAGGGGRGIYYASTYYGGGGGGGGYGSTSVATSGGSAPSSIEYGGSGGKGCILIRYKS